MRLHHAGRSRQSGLALGGILIAALVWVTFAHAGGGSAITIRTLMKTVAFTSVDADHNGRPSVGDYSVAQVVHLDPKTGKRLGTGTAICTQINPAGTLLDCQGSDVFPGGEIREAGRFTFGKTWRLSVIGGSGIYDGASGSAGGTWLDPKLTKSSDTFVLKRRP